MDKLVLKILNRLSAAYPEYMQLEECRNDIDETPSAFKRGVSYLEELALVDLRDAKEGLHEGIYGDIRVTASGIDYLEKRSKKIRATFVR